MVTIVSDCFVNDLGRGEVSCIDGELFLRWVSSRTPESYLVPIKKKRSRRSAGGYCYIAYIPVDGRRHNRSINVPRSCVQLAAGKYIGGDDVKEVIV